jgi:hypothetical protein
VAEDHASSAGAIVSDSASKYELIFIIYSGDIRRHLNARRHGTWTICKGGQERGHTGVYVHCGINAAMGAVHFTVVSLLNDYFRIFQAVF